MVRIVTIKFIMGAVKCLSELLVGMFRFGWLIHFDDVLSLKRFIILGSRGNLCKCSGIKYSSDPSGL